jgi:hypothetical protein
MRLNGVEESVLTGLGIQTSIILATLDEKKQ